MRIRGRRVALLIAGALPLLADNEPSSTATEPSSSTQEEYPISLPQHERNDIGSAVPSKSEEDDGDNNDQAPPTGKIPTLLPLNLLQVEAELNVTETSSFARGTTSLQSSLQEAQRQRIENDLELVEHDQMEDAKNDERFGRRYSTEAEVNKLSDDSEMKSSKDGEDIAEKEASNDKSSTSSFDESGENDSLSEETADSKMSAGDSEGAADADFDVKIVLEKDSQTGDTTHTANTTNIRLAEGEVKEKDGGTPADEGGAHNATATDQEQEGQQSEPEVDKVDDDEDGSIGSRVAVDYASKSAGALVLEKSHNFKGTSNLLNGDRDRYAISPCEEKKFVVLSLSEDIYVKQVKLANYELYSSRVKDFQIQISQTMGNWVDLGTYAATPQTGVQVIDLREPAWGRYLKFKFLSHYGDEFYCTLSQIMVHGSTMVQGFHEHLQEEEEVERLEDDGGRGDSEEAMSADTKVKVADRSAEILDGEEGASEDDSSLMPTISDREDSSAESNKTESTEKTLSDLENNGTETHCASKNLTSERNEEASPSAAPDSQVADVTWSSEEDSSATGTSTPLSLRPTEEHDEAAESRNSDSEKPNSRMKSRKDRNSSSAIPAASIGVSSNVFSSIMGRLEPLHLKSVHRLSRIGEAFPDSDHLHDILAKASDSTKALKSALTDAAILEHLQIWSEDTLDSRQKLSPEDFGSTAIGPREQTLTEKLTAYIEDSDNNRLKQGQEGTDTQASEPLSGNEESDERNEGGSNQVAGQNSAIDTCESQKDPADDYPTGKDESGSVFYDELHDTDLALTKLLDKLPSIECLKALDYAAFKENALVNRKGGHGSAGHTAGGHPSEPIFKLLTDQIKALQANLAIQDQFTKEAVQCYQTVLLDITVELQTLRMDHEIRLKQLEQDLQETKTVRWVFVLYQLIMGLPNWASLFLATFFTSYISPDGASRRVAMLQEFFEKHASEYITARELSILSWTLTVCGVVFAISFTFKVCHRFFFQRGLIFQQKQGTELQSAAQVPEEEVDCKLTIDSEGALVAASKEAVSDGCSASALNGDSLKTETPVMAYQGKEGEQGNKASESEENQHTSEAHLGSQELVADPRACTPSSNEEEFSEVKKAPMSPASVATLSAGVEHFNIPKGSSSDSKSGEASSPVSNAKGGCRELSEKSELSSSLARDALERRNSEPSLIDESPFKTETKLPSSADFKRSSSLNI